LWKLYCNLHTPLIFRINYVWLCWLVVSSITHFKAVDYAMKTQDNKGKSFYRIFCRKLSKPDEESRAKNRGGKERYSELGVFFLSRFFHFFYFFFILSHPYIVFQQLLYTKQREAFLQTSFLKSMWIQITHSQLLQTKV
jgi:hypothetical protein